MGKVGIKVITEYFPNLNTLHEKACGVRVHVGLPAERSAGAYDLVVMPLVNVNNYFMGETMSETWGKTIEAERTYRWRTQDLFADNWDEAAQVAGAYVIDRMTEITQIADNNRNWDAWADEDWVARITAIDPDGSGHGSEDAMEFLAGQGVAEDAVEDSDQTAEEYASDHFPDEWAIHVQERDDWFANDFVDLINGVGDDDLSPWVGWKGDCPYHFTLSA